MNKVREQTKEILDKISASNDLSGSREDIDLDKKISAPYIPWKQGDIERAFANVVCSDGTQ